MTAQGKAYSPHFPCFALKIVTMDSHYLTQILVKVVEINSRLASYFDFFSVALGLCALSLVTFSYVFRWVLYMFFPRCSTNDFIRLISTESETPVFYFKFPFKFYGNYYYCACVRGNRIWTVSKTALEFPESCNLIQRQQNQ